VVTKRKFPVLTGFESRPAYSLTELQWL